MTLKASTLIAVALAALALAAWLGRDLPALRGLWPAPLRDALRQAPAPIDPTAPGRATARKCLGAEQVLYTDGPCPPGTRHQPLAGGAVTVLPAPPAPAPAASVATPLRRLAGEGAVPDKVDRSVDQALQR